MAATAVEGLPLAIQVVRHSVPNASARVVLTGDGGGTWDLRLGDVSGEGEGRGVVVSIVAHVVDWCRLASGRLHPDELVASVEGDLSLALHLLRAAAVVAI